MLYPSFSTTFVEIVVICTLSVQPREGRNQKGREAAIFFSLHFGANESLYTLGVFLPSADRDQNATFRVEDVVDELINQTSCSRLATEIL